ncbi:MAG: FAD:protein FMN transferase [Alphaproteobacteria bacterium]|nr:FAD:protein FMN transferase [Alphaproteobacteria bacterium]
MQETRVIMGLPVCVAVHDAGATADDIEAAFAVFTQADARFTPFRADSELSRLNRNQVCGISAEMQEVLDLAEETRVQSGGYFDIRRPDGALDPCGIVKGWAIEKAAQALRQRGLRDFFIDAGGDIQSCGLNAQGREWRVGIRNPFNPEEIVKCLRPRGAGVATSGTYLRGRHIYNPHDPSAPLDEIVSLTVIGPDILEADRFATACFAMGPAGILFIERLEGFEAYEIDAGGNARMTSGLGRYLA